MGGWRVKARRGVASALRRCGGRRFCEAKQGSQGSGGGWVTREEHSVACWRRSFCKAKQGPAGSPAGWVTVRSISVPVVPAVPRQRPLVVAVGAASPARSRPPGASAVPPRTTGGPPGSADVTAGGQRAACPAFGAAKWACPEGPRLARGDSQGPWGAGRGSSGDKTSHQGRGNLENLENCIKIIRLVPGGNESRT